MTITKLLEQTTVKKAGDKPMVVLPLKIWREVEDKLEDFEMMQSVHFKKKIAKARVQKKLYSSSVVKKLLKLA